MTANMAFPHDREAEEALIGALLINPGAYYDVANSLAPEDFYIQRNRFIWDAIVRLVDEGKVIDFLTVQHELNNVGVLAEIGGPAYLVEMIGRSPSSVNADAYASIIKETASKRRLLIATNKIATLTTKDLAEADMLSEAAKILLEAGTRSGAQKAIPFSQVVSEFFDQVTVAAEAGPEGIGLRTGFNDLDGLLNGLSGGKLIIIAGRPGTGKTSFLLSLVRNIVGTKLPARKYRVVVFSLEMDRNELAERLIAQQARIDTRRLRTGQLAAEEWPKFTEAVSASSEWQLLINDAPALNPTQLKIACKLMHAEAPLDLVVIDYLQLMNGGGKFENRQAEVSYISRQLKGLAKELGVPVIAAAQLSRAVEQRQDKRPVLSDLRESGSIEQDADQVMFLYRPEDDISIVELSVAKHRSGPIGDVQLKYYPAFTLFLGKGA